MPNLASRLARRATPTPAVAVGLAVAMLLVSFVLALYNERAGRAHAIRQAEVQAEILAGSVAAPLAFDDEITTREYVSALGADPAVEAVGAYDAEGRLVAGFTRRGAAPPNSVRAADSVVDGGAITVTRDAVQGSTRLGGIYLRTSVESVFGRAMRYVGIGVVLVMAALLIAALGSSNAALNAAHQRLRKEIDERAKTEEALRQAQKMEAMGQLTGGVAHDFNNLLMVASSGLDLLDRTDDPVRRERLKQGIRQAIDRGANLTQQLLVFARRTPMKSEVVDPVARLAGMKDLLERSLRENVGVELDAPPGIWPVEVDASQLEVAVLNLALNARDAMPNGGRIVIALRNVLAGEPDGQDQVRVTVSDTGVGMPPELLTRVFEPFFTTKGVGEGTGLGLSQVYGFVRASGGEVNIKSQVGRGTTISILLPRSQKALPRPSHRERTRAPSGARKSRVLLVEDDESVAALVSEMLAELGYETTRAATAAGALDLLGSKQTFDVVFSDMVMPGEMNGLDLAHEIARRRPDLPVILTTGYSASAAAAAAEGMRLLVKPFRIEALAAEISEALGGGPEPSRTKH